jgi:hypothetical protein
MRPFYMMLLRDIYFVILIKCVCVKKYKNLMELNEASIRMNKGNQIKSE